MCCVSETCLYLFLIFFKACTFAGFAEASPSISSRNQANIGKDIVFPSSRENDGDLYSSLSPQCTNQTFCENIVDYPTNLFHNILISGTYGSRYRQYFENLAFNEPLIHNRKNNRSEYFICPSKKSVVFPKVALNTKNELKFIFNLETYKQGVTIDTCVKKSKCKFYDKIKNLQTRCKQLFVEKLLLTADSNGRPYVDRYKFPSACVCAYRNSHSRFSKLYKYK